MSFSPSKKRTPKLPENFQEVLATYEMNLNEGITVDIIRNLIYIYTIGMEYYDNVHKEKLQKFYSDKIAQLYSREDVIEFLDKNPIDLNNREGINLFPDYKRVNLIKDNNNNNITNIKIKKNNTFKIMNQKIDPVETNLIIKKKILNVDKKLQKIDDAISQSIIDQMSIFEERKREMMKKKKVIKSQNKTPEKKNLNKEEMEILEQIEKIEKENKLLEKKEENNNKENEKEIENKNEKKSNEEETEIVNDLNDKSSKIINNSIGQNEMLKEIEEYVQKNMDEMYKSLEELKASFADEIKEAEENGYPDIAEGLKEDLEAELENMKDQYEEQRRVETDKIREKYKKKRVF